MPVLEDVVDSLQEFLVGVRQGVQPVLVDEGLVIGLVRIAVVDPHVWRKHVVDVDLQGDVDSDCDRGVRGDNREKNLRLKICRRWGETLLLACFAVSCRAASQGANPT